MNAGRGMTVATALGVLDTLVTRLVRMEKARPVPGCDDSGTQAAYETAREAIARKLELADADAVDARRWRTWLSMAFNTTPDAFAAAMVSAETKADVIEAIDLCTQPSAEVTND